ncbi:branched-chain amino acid aminotransferase [Chitinophaga sp. CF118]|uniref:aminotransferase class IV n=1 Tax=Chitinophaga sp. CF118 TaxID=1884367 RepID=UPI0008E604BD|nr:aminotransferase class IV [Chitinophaga sp. CF118]SFD12677.1 branched-chain amino acid aminotransferase [Chitinophaga sp. CF118]
MQSGCLCYNGKFLPASDTILTADNRSFRYGDGCFETMRVYQGEVLLADLHFERLMASLHLLHFDPPQHFTKTYFTKLVMELCNRNDHDELSRVRLTVFRGDGGLYDPLHNIPHFIIQSWELDKKVLELNDTGLELDIFPDVRIACDKFSSIKSNNSLRYVMAAMYAKQHRIHEAILLNPYGRVADTTTANLFIVQHGQLITPPLSEGCVCGVMRKNLLKMDLPFPVIEKPLTVEDLENADEIFLTNAIAGIRWVGMFRDSSFGNASAVIIHELLHEGIL